MTWTEQPPTDKQIRFAMSLVRRLGIEDNPFDLMTRGQVSDRITEMKNALARINSGDRRIDQERHHRDARKEAWAAVEAEAAYARNAYVDYLEARWPDVHTSEYDEDILATEEGYYDRAISGEWNGIRFREEAERYRLAAAELRAGRPVDFGHLAEWAGEAVMNDSDAFALDHPSYRRVA